MSTGNGNGYHPATASLTDTLPPHSPEIERCVLGDLLLDPGQMAIVLAILDADDFYSEVHQAIFRVMEDLHAAGKSWDVDILAIELERRGQFQLSGGDDYLLKIANSVPHAVLAEQHAGYVKEFADRRRVIQSSHETAREAYSNELTAGQIVDRARGRFGQIPTALEPWPELALQREPEPPPFPADVFPLALERYCRGVAAVTLAPADLPGAAMLATASAAIGQSVNLFIKRTWHESPLLYMLIVAEPGKSKTPPIKLVVKPLTQVDGELRTRSKAERAAWEDLKRTAPKGTDPGPEPPQQRAVVKDITRETLVAILADNPRGVLADPDEATAWVGSFNEYKGKGTDRQFWLDIWSSRAISVDREAGRRSSWVACPLVTVLAGIPPEMLGALGEEQGRNDGFHDRLLFTYPSRFPRHEWIEDELDAGDETTWATVVRKLQKAPLCWDEERKAWRPHVVDFSPAAKEIWRQWYNAHCAQEEADDAPLWMPGAWAKLRGYCARFCLILSRLRLATDPDCATGDVRGPVLEQDARGAIKLIDYFKGHIARIQHRTTGGTGNRDAQAVLGWIARKGVSEFKEAEPRDDLRRRFPDPKLLVGALRALVEVGAIRPKTATPATVHRRGRKPSQTYEVHPDLETVLKRP